MNAHTPGPWFSENDSGVVSGVAYIPIWADGRVVSYVLSHSPASRRPIAEWEANAHLIAASPDLLGALKAMDGYYAKRWTGGPDDFTPEQRSWIDEEFLTAWRKVRTAIANAEGR